MRSLQLIKRSLGHYWRTNAAVVGGVGVAVAVLAGALIVGDSVRGSLRSLFLQRIGRTEVLVSSNGFFREGLADELRANEKFKTGGFDEACPLVALDSAVIHDASGRRASAVQLYGVDARFWKFHELEGQVAPPEGGELLLSPGLARELGAASGETVRVRVEKPSAIPVESLHGRREDVGRTVRLTVREVLPPERLGEFALRPQQGEVRAAFMSLARLQKETARAGRANALLMSGASAEGADRAAAAGQLLREAFALEDLGLNLRVLGEQGALSLESESALLTDETAERARAAARDAGLRPVGLFSYLANTIRANGREIPYSLVTALEPETFGQLAQSSTASGDSAGSTLAATPQPQSSESSPAPMLLNEWAARDLGVKVGDEIEIDYYLWREEGRLSTETAKFRLAGVVPVAGLAADRELTPEYPGISDTDSLSDWDPPFPVDLSRVREQDEQYWDTYRTTPKAFIPLERGRQLWRTRFGNLTSLRLYPPAPDAEPGVRVDLEPARAEFARRLRAGTDPLASGLSVAWVRGEGLRAAEGATDFGEYFLYFSFFIVVSALLLASLFFRFGVEQRVREIGLLQAVGFPAARIRRLFLAEGLALAAAGSLLGLAGALAYGWLMMWGLRTWWVDAVGTRSLQLHVSPLSLAAGAVGGVLAALVCVWLSLRALRRVSTRGLLAGVFERAEGERVKGKGKTAGHRDQDRFEGEGGRLATADLTSGIPNPQSPIRNPQSPRAPLPFALFAAAACGALGLTLLALAAAGVVGEAAGFFGAGVLLLVALLAAVSAWLRRGRPGGVIGARVSWPVARLGFRNAAHRPGRSVLCVALVASAAFIIVSVDAFRQDAHGTSSDRRSGAGGYALVAETLLPVTHDPNSAEGREALGLDIAHDEGKLAGVTLARFRLRPGDDASCLNLYQPRDPRVLSAPPGFVRENRFRFQDSLAETDAQRANPWLLLEKDLADGAIPAAADAKSLAYVLHKKLGDEIVVKGGGGEDVRLRIVAALSDSLFQSELVVGEKNFLRAFPERQGFRYFLIDAPADRADAAAGVLEETLSDYGFDAASTAERLASYHRVENTYLSTFQTLGGLGMLLGTLGLAAVLLRNVFERRRELALLRAVGYGPRQISVMVFGENALLLVAGLLTGTACALLAIAPAWLARAGTGRGFNLSLAALLFAVLVTGFAASLAATLAALRSPLLPALRAE